MRSYSDRRSRSIRQMTGTTSFSASSSGGAGGDGIGRSIASGQIIQGGGMTITRRHGEPTSSAPESAPSSSASNSSPPQDDYFDSNGRSGRHSYAKPLDDDVDGIEEEAITFPQSTHSWLFTQHLLSLPFWFSVGIVALSYTCLILALVNIFEEWSPDNPFNVPYQVQPTVRIAQYLAMIIALIMEEEIPTGV
jgi:hypothetical protein